MPSLHLGGYQTRVWITRFEIFNIRISSYASGSQPRRRRWKTEEDAHSRRNGVDARTDGAPGSHSGIGTVGPTRRKELVQQCPRRRTRIPREERNTFICVSWLFADCCGKWHQTGQREESVVSWKGVHSILSGSRMQVQGAEGFVRIQYSNTHSNLQPRVWPVSHVLMMEFWRKYKTMTNSLISFLKIPILKA